MSFIHPRDTFSYDTAESSSCGYSISARSFQVKRRPSGEILRPLPAAVRKPQRFTASRPHSPFNRELLHEKDSAHRSCRARVHHNPPLVVLAARDLDEDFERRFASSLRKNLATASRP
jgi:hypothetical protein